MLASSIIWGRNKSWTRFQFIRFRCRDFWSWSNATSLHNFVLMKINFQLQLVNRAFDLCQVFVVFQQAQHFSSVVATLVAQILSWSLNSMRANWSTHKATSLWAMKLLFQLHNLKEIIRKIGSFNSNPPRAQFLLVDSTERDKMKLNSQCRGQRGAKLKHAKRKINKRAEINFLPQSSRHKKSRNKFWGKCFMA